MAPSDLANGRPEGFSEVGYGSPLMAVRRALLPLVSHDRMALTGDCLTIDQVNETGFTISLLRSSDCWIVFFDDWHDEFPDLEMVLVLIGQALSGNVRLRVDRMGQKPWRWTVERKLADRTWVALYSNAVFMLGRGQAKDTVIFCNGRDDAKQEAPLALRLALKHVG